MATEAAAANLAALGLPKLNTYTKSRGGRGGSRPSNRGGAGAHHGSRGGAGGAPAPGQKPQRRRTIERKLARAKGTNRMVDPASGAMMGRAMALANAKTKLQRRLAAEGGAAVAPLTEEEKAQPLKKKAKHAAPAVKKGQLLPSSSGTAPPDAASATLPAFLRALGVGPGDRDANGEAPWDLDEERRFYELQLGVRRKKKKKAAKAPSSDGNESDEAELDTGAMSKLRQELDEDGLGDLFDFCDLLESGGGEGGDAGDMEEEDDGAMGFDHGDDGQGDAPAAASKKDKKKSSASSASSSSSDPLAGYSLAKRQRILEKEAAIDAREDEMAAALKEAMEKAAKRAAKANAKQARMDQGKDMEDGSEEEDEEEEGSEEEEDDEDGEDEEEDEEDEDAEMDEDEDAPASRKRRREAEDEEDDEDGSEEDGEEGSDAEEDDEEGSDAAGDDAAQEEEEEDAAPARKKPSIEDLYGFNAPVPDSLLAFRRGDKNIMAAAGTSAASADAGAKAGSTTAAPAVPTKYVPPHLRAQLAAAAAAVGPAASPAAAAAANVGVSSATTAAGLASLRRQLKGLLNRLTSANLEHIALQMTSTLYAQHSKREVTSLLCEELLALCTVEAEGTTGGYALGSNSSTLLAAAALVVFLHATVGGDIGAHFLEKFVLAFRDFSARASVDAVSSSPAAAAAAVKSATTLVTFLTYLYSLDLVSSKLVYELVRHFVSDFTPLSIELLLVVLQNAGAGMRKDDPASLKEIVLRVQQKAKEHEAAAKDAASKGKAGAPGVATMPEGRVAFMLSTIYDLKNNKKRSAAALADSITPLSNWLQGKLKRRAGVEGHDWQLRFGYEDIINIPSRGRWWLVGSAWKGKRATDEGEAEAKAAKEAAAASSSSSAAPKVVLPAESPSDQVDLLSLARSAHMNTGLRRSLFLVVMSASDFMECFERLCRLALPPAQLRQVVKVLLECAQNERSFNPYYAHVLLQLCRMEGSAGKEMRFTLQLALWDLMGSWGAAEQASAMRAARAKLRTEEARKAWQTQQQRQVLNIAKLVALIMREPAAAAPNASKGVVSHGGPAIASAAGGGLTLFVLKALDFHELSPLQLLFLTAALKDFLLLSDLRHVTSSALRMHSTLEDKKTIAAGRSDEVKLLRDGIDFFLQHHLTPTAQALTNKEQGAKLKARIATARQALAGNVNEDWMFEK